MLKKPDWQVMVCVAVALYYWWSTVSLENELAGARQQHAEYRQKVAEANDKATRALVAEINRIDTEKSKEAASAKAEAADLRDCITSGRCRVLIQADSTGGVPTTTPTPGVGDGACGPDVPARTAAALVDLADRADQLVYRLSACQAYVKQVTK